MSTNSRSLPEMEDWLQQQQQQTAASAAAVVERLAHEPCAINFFGLPRAFQSLVLPSIIQNVIKPNAKYQCDYFVHYYNLTFEQAGRSGDGGHLNPHEIRLLTEAVHNVSIMMTYSDGNITRQPTTTTIIAYEMTQEADFWTQYKSLLHKTRTVKDTNGKLLYHPWKESTYHMTQIANIIKMWHSIQAVFELMQSHGRRRGFEYTRVAMLRSDVLYMTPVDIWQRGAGDSHRATTTTAVSLDAHNQVAVVPDFANYPVNDRMIYGPASAVRTWATTRFATLDEHVQWILDNKPGYGMHSETFVSRLLDRIQQEQGYQVEHHETLCFFRVRADESVWLDDCSQSPPFANPKIRQHLPLDLKMAVEEILGRTCDGNINHVAPESSSMAVQCPVDPSIYWED